MRGCAALHLDPVPRAARIGVEEPRLLDHPGEGVAVAAQQAVGRPEVERVLAAPLQALAVELGLPAEPLRVAAAEPGGHVRVRHDLARPHLVGAHLAVGGEGRARPIPPERGEEDLEGEVGVEGAGDLGDPVEVPVDEAGQPVVVLEGAPSAAPAHVEAALGEAEVALDVDRGAGGRDGHPCRRHAGRGRGATASAWRTTWAGSGR